MASFTTSVTTQNLNDRLMAPPPMPITIGPIIQEGQRMPSGYRREFSMHTPVPSWGMSYRYPGQMGSLRPLLPLYGSVPRLPFYRPPVESVHTLPEHIIRPRSPLTCPLTKPQSQNEKEPASEDIILDMRIGDYFDKISLGGEPVIYGPHSFLMKKTKILFPALEQGSARTEITAYILPIIRTTMTFPSENQLSHYSTFFAPQKLSKCLLNVWPENLFHTSLQISDLLVAEVPNKGCRVFAHTKACPFSALIAEINRKRSLKARNWDVKFDWLTPIKSANIVINESPHSHKIGSNDHAFDLNKSSSAAVRPELSKPVNQLYALRNSIEHNEEAKEVLMNVQKRRLDELVEDLPKDPIGTAMHGETRTFRTEIDVRRFLREMSGENGVKPFVEGVFEKTSDDGEVAEDNIMAVASAIMTCLTSVDVFECKEMVFSSLPEDDSTERASKRIRIGEESE